VDITWERYGSERVCVDAFYVPRLGKCRGEMIRYLAEAGDAGATVAELEDGIGTEKTCLRDFIDLYIYI